MSMIILEILRNNVKISENKQFQLLGILCNKVSLNIAIINSVTKERTNTNRKQQQ